MEKRITLKILSFCSAAIVLCSVVFINKKDNISSDITNTHLSTCSSHSNYCPEDAKVVRDFTNGKLDWMWTKINLPVESPALNATRPVFNQPYEFVQHHGKERLFFLPPFTAAKANSMWSVDGLCDETRNEVEGTSLKNATIELYFGIKFDITRISYVQIQKSLDKVSELMRHSNEDRLMTITNAIKNGLIRDVHLTLSNLSTAISATNDFSSEKARFTPLSMDSCLYKHVILTHSRATSDVDMKFSDKGDAVISYNDTTWKTDYSPMNAYSDEFFVQSGLYPDKPNDQKSHRVSYVNNSCNYTGEHPMIFDGDCGSGFDEKNRSHYKNKIATDFDIMVYYSLQGFPDPDSDFESESSSIKSICKHLYKENCVNTIPSFSNCDWMCFQNSLDHYHNVYSPWFKHLRYFDQVFRKERSLSYGKDVPYYTADPSHNFRIRNNSDSTLPFAAIRTFVASMNPFLPGKYEGREEEYWRKSNTPEDYYNLYQSTHTVTYPINDNLLLYGDYNDKAGDWRHLKCRPFPRIGTASASGDFITSANTFFFNYGFKMSNFGQTFKLQLHEDSQAKAHIRLVTSSYSKSSEMPNIDFFIRDDKFEKLSLVSTIDHAQQETQFVKTKISTEGAIDSCPFADTTLLCDLTNVKPSTKYKHSNSESLIHDFTPESIKLICNKSKTFYSGENLKELLKNETLTLKLEAGLSVRGGKPILIANAGHPIVKYGDGCVNYNVMNSSYILSYGREDKEHGLTTFFVDSPSGTAPIPIPDVNGNIVAGMHIELTLNDDDLNLHISSAEDCQHLRLGDFNLETQVFMNQNIAVTNANYTLQKKELSSFNPELAAKDPILSFDDLDIRYQIPKEDRHFYRDTLDGKNNKYQIKNTGNISDAISGTYVDVDALDANISRFSFRNVFQEDLINLIKSSKKGKISLSDAFNAMCFDCGNISMLIDIGAKFTVSNQSLYPGEFEHKKFNLSLSNPHDYSELSSFNNIQSIRIPCTNVGCKSFMYELILEFNPNCMLFSLDKNGKISLDYDHSKRMFNLSMETVDISK